MSAYSGEYRTEQLTVRMGDREVALENRAPIYSDEERRREYGRIEEGLYAVFSKHSG